MKTRGDYIVFGEGANEWVAPHPGFACDASMASAYHYLTSTCPDTKSAVAKLREIRRALRERPSKEPTR